MVERFAFRYRDSKQEGRTGEASENRIARKKGSQ